MKHLSNVLAVATFLILMVAIVVSNIALDPLWPGILYCLSIASALSWVALNTRLLIYFFSKKSTRSGVNLGFVVLLVFFILCLVNFLSKEYSYRKDITRSGLNSLSPQTVKILDSLTQDVSIQYFNAANEREKAEAVFRNYTHESKHVKFEFVDTVRRPTLAQSLGIKKNDESIFTLANTKKTVRVDGTSEENITNGFVKLLRAKEEVIYFTTGHNERSIETAGPLAYTGVKTELEKQGFAVKELNLFTEGKMPTDAAAVILAGPQSAFYPKELELLSAWIKGGGHIFVAVDVDPAQNGLARGSAQVAELLKPYGVETHDKMLVDPLSSAANVEPQILLGFSASREHPITKDFTSSSRAANFFFPLTTYFTETEVNGFTTTVLVKSSPAAWAAGDWGTLKSGSVKFNPAVDHKGVMDLALAIEPKVPAPEPGAKEAPPPVAPKGPRIAAFATSTFASNTVFDKVGNRDLALNAISWLADDAQLISIRPKENKESLKPFSPGTLNLVLIFSVFALPLALILAGVFVWLGRSRL